MAHTGRRHLTIAIASFAAALLSGCAGTPIATERQARADLERVRTVYRPGDAKPNLPRLHTESPLADFLRYAILNNPRVEAAYYEWAASVERITPARSLPDPRLTFEADMSNMLDAVMPGLMLDLPGPGKLQAAGDVAAADAQVGYFSFEGEVLAAAYATKSAYIRLRFLSDTIRVQRESLALLSDLESLAQQQVGAGRGTIQDVLRAQIERDQLANQIANLEDSRSVLDAEFRAALGHAPADASLPIPSVFDVGTPPPSADVVLGIAAERNPVIRQMKAEVKRGEAMLDLARTSRVPDFTIGIEADVKASPIMWRPTASMTLPVWRDKIAAEIATAQAEKRSAEARLSAEEIALAAELASMLYIYREGGRTATLFESSLLPKAQQSLEAARSGYASGRSSFLDVIDSQRRALAFELGAIEAKTQQELAIASISLVIAGAAPEGAPVLPVNLQQPSEPKENRP
jgi:outer membrane protein, heavy metal efflux system